MILLYNDYTQVFHTSMETVAQADLVAYMEDDGSWNVIKDRITDETGPVRTGNILERVVRHLRAYDTGV